MLIAALLLSLQAVPAATPSPEAVTLGLRLAHTGVLATALPLASASSTDQLLAQHPELSAADRAALRATAQAVAARETERVLTLEGQQYAAALSIEDLRALVAAAEAPAAQHQRAAFPRIMAATMQAMGSIDLGRQAWTEFCAQPGRTCPATH